jgi:hypothetical protein
MSNKSRTVMNTKNYSINDLNGVMANTGKSNPSPVKFNMGNGVLGSYDNLQLKTPCPSGWKNEPCEPPIKSNKLFVPQGTPLPLKNEMIYSELPEDSMFIFDRAYSSPDCCPSTFSTDRGCVCTSSTQRKYIGEERGKNKTYGNYSF